MTAEQDGNAEVASSPADWVARQAELYESSGGTKGTTQAGRALPADGLRRPAAAGRCGARC